MAEQSTCPKCGAPATDTRVRAAPGFACGSHYNFSGGVAQSDRCRLNIAEARIAELEAALEHKSGCRHCGSPHAQPLTSAFVSYDCGTTIRNGVESRGQTCLETKTRTEELEAANATLAKERDEMRAALERIATPPNTTKTQLIDMPLEVARAILTKYPQEKRP